MDISAKTKLRPLKDSGLTLRADDEDIRSRKVLDQHGEELGEIEELLIDDAEQKVRFLRVASGGFLGLGKSRVLIPAEAIASITEDEVRIDQSREHVSGSPAYDPELIDEDYYTRLYRYYGVEPYWGPGYVSRPSPPFSGMGPR